MAYLFTPAEAAAVPDVLSQPRFKTYMLAKNSVVEDALALYQWNAEASAAFLYVIHLFEICVRNAVANAAESAYGANWPSQQNFMLSLPNPGQPNFSPKRELNSTRSRAGNTTTGKIIADIKLAFWESMYTSRHDNRLWTPYLSREFPHLPAGMTVQAARSRIHDVCEVVRRLRNRIAHHEPVFTRTLTTDYEGILEIVGYRSVQTAYWLSRTQTVLPCLNHRP